MADSGHNREDARPRRKEQARCEGDRGNPQVVEAALDAIITIDHDDRITSFNPAAERIFGWRRQEVIGRDLAKIIIPPAMRQAHWHGMERHRDSLQASFLGKRLELTALRADGSEFPVEMIVTRMGEDDQPMFAAFIRDLTVIRRVQAQDRRHAQRLAAVVEAQRELALSEADEEQLTARIAQMAGKLLAADGAAFKVLEGDHLRTRSAYGACHGYLGTCFSLDDSLSGLAVRLNKTVRCDDRASDPRLDQRARCDTGWNSMMAGVLRIAGAAVGVIWVSSSQQAYFTDDDENALNLLTETLGAVLGRRRDAERLKASEQQYRALFVEQPLLMSVYDPATLGFFAVNAAGLAHYGYTEEEFLRLTIMDLFPEEDRATAGHTMFATPLQGRRRHRGRHLKKSGEIFFVETFSNDIQFQGKPARVVLAIDTTEPRRVALDLRQSEARFRALTELSADWFWEQDENFRFVNVSNAGNWPSEVPPPPLILGKTRWELEDLEMNDWQAHRELLQAHQPFHDLEVRRRLPDGSLRHICISGGPVFDKAGRFTGYRGVGRDITAQKQAQAEITRLNVELEERVRQRTEQLEAANAELKAFAYSIAHDLRSPLTSIDGFSQVLDDSCGSRLNDRERHCLRRIRAGVRQMSDLTDGMLSLARLSRVTIRRDKTDLAALARGALAHWQECEPEREVAADIPEHLWVRGEPSLLDQAMTNLVGNAWKFSGRKPQVSIRVGCERQANGETVYFVADQGAGFDMDHASRLFGTFQRLHSPSEFEGTGIGLALVHKIVTHHGGRIWASAKLGEGATFYFTLGPDDQGAAADVN